MLSAVFVQPSRRPCRALVGILLAAAVVLPGCQSKTAGLGGGDDLTTSSTSGDVSFKKTGELARQWEADKSNAKVGLAYADELEKLGQRPTAFSVMKSVADANPDKADVQAQVGRRLMAAGNFEDAAGVLERAAAADPQDYRALSALGSAYDQLARHGEAREQYQKALAIKPDAVATRNNLAMSYALQGQLAEAEKMLRELMNSGGTNAARVRQNLALVVGLQGRFDEAKKIASEDLPPDQVETNLAYLQKMLSRPNTWKQLQDGSGADGNG